MSENKSEFHNKPTSNVIQKVPEGARRVFENSMTQLADKKFCHNFLSFSYILKVDQILLQTKFKYK